MTLLDIIPDSTKVIAAGADFLLQERSLDLEKRILKAVIDYFLVAVFFYAIGYGGYRVLFKGDEISDLFTKNPRKLFEALTFGSTILEIISLSLIAIDRGIPMSAGIIRYGLVGIVEIAASFQFSRYVAIIFIDRKVDKKDKKAGIWAVIWFVVSFLCTYFIWWLYTENAGANVFTIDGLSPILDRSIADTTRGELGAWFTVFITVPFNILNAIFQYQKMVSDNLEDSFKEDIHDKINKKDDKKKKDLEDKIADTVAKIEDIKEQIKNEKDPDKKNNLFRHKAGLDKKLHNLNNVEKK